MEETLFVDVIIPLSVPKLYTYRVPREWTEEVMIGKRVVVQFGSRKLYSGLVREVHQQPPQHYTAKYIDSVLDAQPIVHDQQLQFWQWVSDYYMCSIGEVMNAALPGGFRLTSETRLILHPAFNQDFSHLDDNEYLVAEALQANQVLAVSDVMEILNRKEVYPMIKQLIEKHVLLVEEEWKQRFTPKKVTYVKLAETVEGEEGLQACFEQLQNAPKQQAVLMAYIELSQCLAGAPAEVKKQTLLKRSGATAAVINAMEKKTILVGYQREEGRLPEGEVGSSEGIVLNAHQQQALEEIGAIFEEKDVVLFHGVTASGKTEVYVELIRKVLAEGKQVLYLLPEIALTTQIIHRLRRYFGDKVGIYHSRFNHNERVEVWNRVLQDAENGYDIVLGARSAVFLPFHRLGLVIVDEEHESSFKQFDPAPRYHARDASIVLARQFGAKVLLGSATPAVESFQNAQDGKYGLVTLSRRYGGVQMPEIFVADIRKAQRRKEMRSSFTPMLLAAMREAMEVGEQIILFQNRRGFSPYVICEDCGWSPECKRCDVGLTYHKYQQQLRCHYCGYHVRMPTTCVACGSTGLVLKGLGTEKIEEELEILLPEAKVARMDLDTTRTRNAHQRIIQEFEARQIDILVGTQMVTKGLDFDNVGLVGIMNADSLLSYPDFRAFERSYHLMSQVAGRAGRSAKRGKVVIQSYNPYHQVIRQVIDHDYSGLFKDQVVERRNFQYPPFYRMIRITLKHRDRDKVNDGAAHLARALRKVFGDRILGPEFPIVARIRNQYLKNILFKLERTAHLGKCKQALREAIIDFQTTAEFKSVRVVLDVDPY